MVNLSIYQTYQNEFASDWNIDRRNTVDLNRLRFRPLIRWGNGNRVVLEYEVDALASWHPLMLFDTGTDARPRQTIDLYWSVTEQKHLKIFHYIDRFYYRKNFAWGSLVVGRQRISWGTGRIWNPTDLFNPINPASFEKIEKDGADALLLKYFLGPFSDIQLVYNVEKDWKQQNVAFRLRSNWHTFDLSVLGGRVGNRWRVGGDFAGNLGGAGIRGEALITAKPGEWDSDFIKYILGIDHQLTPRLYGLLEYHYNGQGRKHVNEYNLEALFRGEILNLARNYFFLQFNYQIHPLVIVSLMQNKNLDDGSGFAGTTVTISTGNNSSLVIGAQGAYGGKFKEYWYYPTALYLRFDWYF